MIRKCRLCLADLMASLEGTISIFSMILIFHLKTILTNFDSNLYN